MFDKYLVSSRTNITHSTDMTGVENAIKSLNSSVEKLVEIQQEGFVLLQDTSIRLSSIDQISKIKENSFQIITNNNKVIVCSENLIEVYDAYNKLAKSLNIPTVLLEGMGICPKCDTTYYKKLPHTKYPDYEKLISMCPECRKDFMLQNYYFKLSRDLASFNDDLRIEWGDGQVDILSSSLIDPNLYSFLHQKLGNSY
jgi:hypothetical protein